LAGDARADGHRRLHLFHACTWPMCSIIHADGSACICCCCLCRLNRLWHHQCRCTGCTPDAWRHVATFTMRLPATCTHNSMDIRSDTQHRCHVLCGTTGFNTLNRRGSEQRADALLWCNQNRVGATQTESSVIHLGGRRASKHGRTGELPRVAGSATPAPAPALATAAPAAAAAESVPAALGVAAVAARAAARLDVAQDPLLLRQVHAPEVHDIAARRRLWRRPAAAWARRCRRGQAVRRAAGRPAVRPAALCRRRAGAAGARRRGRSSGRPIRRAVRRPAAPAGRRPAAVAGRHA